ncbi:DUF1653 domain-containing protein [Sulfuricurvum sp.]|uniref:DUF1653 domain-containing protein n=1 Tax=Sulfuricurvum sp. TaxID=2025608 RepID=UPI00198BB4FC|nr:DUF1653 domain-containing protein [Sulfuricurvum sp.]MBD3799494.1 DUF1653 domain-containing protein [Campylobacterota bacterium]MBD3806259.1 DUF1653 domain-containing protein [Sulfuricurvum sp.]
MLKSGLYRHYKGKYYEVIGVAKHSETFEHLVVYRPLYGERGLWVRPYTMFIEIMPNGVKRFEYCGEIQ